MVKEMKRGFFVWHLRKECGGEQGRFESERRSGFPIEGKLQPWTPRRERELGQGFNCAYGVRC